MKVSLVLRPVVFIVAFIAGSHAWAAEQIQIDGSTGVTPLVAALAKAYREHNPNVTIHIGKGLGTKARIEALREGKIDIAMASHGLNVESIKKQGMTVHEIAKVAVVFGVNASVPVADLDDTQICDIYSLAKNNWKELGSSDTTIVPITRPDSEVDTEVVRHHIGCLTKLKMSDAVSVAPKAGEMAQALASTPGAIGMTTMTVVEQSAGRIKPVSLRGVAPTAANVRSKAYNLTRDSFLVTQAAPAPAVAKFLEFVRSSAGEKIIAANGAVPAR
ncbi:MAG: phosphate ABC transporter substrate-binding protein [Betaproteobacteria bacterium]